MQHKKMVGLKMTKYRGPPYFMTMTEPVIVQDSYSNV